ncbi:conserved hypothetical protein [Ricinus communis]|uniref:Uncharacterized protein n=1 Tax=Ricinus communis TaxID=3988 RepID=B9TIH7_RICCO|nr:conserved hypothetical protein [Ricinus communis]
MARAVRGAGGITDWKVMRAPLAQFTMPMLFGPTMRTPVWRLNATRRACCATRSAIPVSAKPDANTMAARVPISAQDRMPSSTVSRLPTSTAQSGTSGSRSIEG